MKELRFQNLLRHKKILRNIELTLKSKLQNIPKEANLTIKGNLISIEYGKKKTYFSKTVNSFNALIRISKDFETSNLWFLENILISKSIPKTLCFELIRNSRELKKHKLLILKFLEANSIHLTEYSRAQLESKPDKELLRILEAIKW